VPPALLTGTTGGEVEFGLGGPNFAANASLDWQFSEEGLTHFMAM
jgi:hypothetical protein